MRASSGSTAAYVDGAFVDGSAPQRQRPFRVVRRIKFADVICEKKRAAADRPGPCKGVAVLRATRRYPGATPARTARGDVGWCKDWKAEMRGLYYVNWREAAEGTFCWIEGPSAPAIYRNTWKCGDSSAIGYDVQPVDCWDERRSGDTTYDWWISIYDKFRVSAVVRGFPMHWTYQFHVNLHPTGATKAYVD